MFEVVDYPTAYFPTTIELSPVISLIPLDFPVWLMANQITTLDLDSDLEAREGSISELRTRKRRKREEVRFFIYVGF